jgi:hypothetical protein
VPDDGQAQRAADSVMTAKRTSGGAAGGRMIPVEVGVDLVHGGEALREQDAL